MPEAELEKSILEAFGQDGTFNMQTKYSLKIHSFAVTVIQQ